MSDDRYVAGERGQTAIDALSYAPGPILKKYLLAFDFLLATPVFVNLAWLLPPTISTTLAKDLFAAAMSVLSITFSVFFAALAVIISGSDNDFVRFLEEDGSYTKITETFRFTLEAIFLALLMSVFGFGLASAQVANQCSEQSKWFLVGFSFFFLYSLLAALGIARDSITYARFRTQFLRSRPQDPRVPKVRAAMGKRNDEANKLDALVQTLFPDDATVSEQEVSAFLGALGSNVEGLRARLIEAARAFAASERREQRAAPPYLRDVVESLENSGVSGGGKLYPPAGVPKADGAGAAEAGAVHGGDRADPRGGHDAAGAAQTKELERRARKLLGVRR